MRILLLALILSAAAEEVPMLIPLGSVELAVPAGATASAPLASARHQRGMAALRGSQRQEGPLELTVLLRVQGGPSTVNLRPAAAGAQPLASAVLAVGDSVLRVTPPEAVDLVLEATTEAGGPVQIVAVAYAGFLQPGILQALERAPDAQAEAAEAAEADEVEDPALAPFTAEASNLHQILSAMIAHQGDFEGVWPVAVGVTGVPMPPQTPEQARLITAASFELLARRMELPSQLFVSPFSPGRTLPAARSEAEILAQPDAAWAEDFAYDWAVPGETAAYRVVLASRHFVAHPTLGLGVSVVCTDGSAHFLPADPAVEVRGASTAGLSGFGDDLLPAVVNPDAAGSTDSEGPDAPAGEPDNIFDDQADGEPGSGLTIGTGDPRRAFVK